MPSALENTLGRLGRTVRSLATGIIILGSLGLAATLWLGGCATPADAGTGHAATEQKAEAPESLNLKEGDVIKITFPGVPGMDTQQAVRQDGRITLPIIGEYIVLGKTTDGLAKELLEQYASQLVSKEINVTLVSSSYTLYVTGAVLRPGKIVTDRKLTAYEAIMEAGGFDKTKADLKSVVVVRQENGQSHSYTVNLQQVLKGGQVAPFYLKPFDSVYVPEKFNWF